MFNRASLKLGLDKAVFATGAFSKGEETRDLKKSDKAELEMLLKKGA